MMIPVDLTSKDLDNFEAGEYEFIITKAEPRTNESGAVEAVVLYHSCTSPEYQGKTIAHRVNLPQPSDTPEQIYMKKKFLKIACSYFNVIFDSSGFDYTAFIGKSCRALVKPTPDKKTGNVYDNIVRWL